MKEITEDVALQKLRNLCARSEHSSGDVLEKMHQWELPADAQARIMESLISDRYIDDERFTRAFVGDKIRYNHWGRRKIEQALSQKRVDKSVQQRVLSEVDESEYLSVLGPLLRTKQRSITGRNAFERQMKLIRFALSRGFSMDQIRQTIDVKDIDLDL